MLSMKYSPLLPANAGSSGERTIRSITHWKDEAIQDCQWQSKSAPNGRVKVHHLALADDLLFPFGFSSIIVCECPQTGWQHQVHHPR